MRGKGGAEVITSQIFWVLQAPLESGLILRTLGSQHELIYDLKDHFNCQVENYCRGQRRRKRGQKRWWPGPSTRCDNADA